MIFQSARTFIAVTMVTVAAMMLMSTLNNAVEAVQQTPSVVLARNGEMGFDKNDNTFYGYSIKQPGMFNDPKFAVTYIGNGNVDAVYDNTPVRVRCDTINRSEQILRFNGFNNITLLVQESCLKWSSNTPQEIKDKEIIGCPIRTYHIKRTPQEPYPTNDNMHCHLVRHRTSPNDYGKWPFDPRFAKDTSVINDRISKLVSQITDAKVLIDILNQIQQGMLFMRKLKWYYGLAKDDGLDCGSTGCKVRFHLWGTVVPTTFKDIKPENKNRVITELNTKNHQLISTFYTHLTGQERVLVEAKVKNVLAAIMIIV
ncbi:hypothetical protein BDF19DRAFT_438584 [Syncephalis fuscata]|nr:hypothetical protein BDF19DRAFT_438584 [Syncephalis fuscata]